VIIGVALALFVPWAKAYTWHDTIGWAQYGVSEVINYANWAAQEANTAATELNTLRSYEQQVIQLARMGDPAALSQLTGVNSITSLYRDYAMVSADIWQMKNAVNPQGFQGQFNSILATYKQPNWQGVITYGGGKFLPTAGNFQFATANYSAAQTAQQTIASLTQQRQTIQSQRDSALQSLQAATTQSDVQKWTAVVQALNASMTHVDAEIQQVVEQAKLQQTQNAAAQSIYSATQREQIAASMQNGFEQDLGSFARVAPIYMQPAGWSNSSGGNTTSVAPTNIPSSGGVVIQ
jgi:ATP-dependent Lon protease